MISPVKWGEFSLENIPKENKLHSPHGLVQLCRYLKKKNIVSCTTLNYVVTCINLKRSGCSQ